VEIVEFLKVLKFLKIIIIVVKMKNPKSTYWSRKFKNGKCTIIWSNMEEGSH
jgi:hypothetical protein